MYHHHHFKLNIYPKVNRKYNTEIKASELQMLNHILSRQSDILDKEV